MGKFQAVLLPLPLGEVALRSKDGEGARSGLSAKASRAMRMLPVVLKPSPWGRWLDAKRQDGRGNPTALQMQLTVTTPPVKMRLEHSAELVGAKPLHLLTQTDLPLKSPTGAFIATLRSANAVAPNAKLKIIFPLIMRKVQRRRPPPAAETGRSCWGSGQQDASAAQGTKRMLGAATR